MTNSELVLALVHAGWTNNRNKGREIMAALAERGFTFAAAYPDNNSTTESGTTRPEEEAA